MSFYAKKLNKYSYFMWFCIFFCFLRIVHFPENHMLIQKLLLRIAWFMTSQQPFWKMEEKVFFTDFIEIFQSKMKRLNVNKSFDLIILEKIEDSKLNLMQMCSRLYELLTSFFTLLRSLVIIQTTKSLLKLKWRSEVFGHVRCTLASLITKYWLCVPSHQNSKFSISRHLEIFLNALHNTGQV